MVPYLPNKKVLEVTFAIQAQEVASQHPQAEQPVDVRSGSHYVSYLLWGAP